MSTELVSGRPPHLLRRLYIRFTGLIHELGKFGVVGGLAFLTDLVVFNLCLALFDGDKVFLAKVISTVIAATAAFFGNRFWTWNDRPTTNLRKEYLLYFVFNAIGLGIALSCLWISHSALGSVWPETFQTRLADNIAAQGFGLVFGTIFRFYAYRRWVFTRPADPNLAIQP